MTKIGENMESGVQGRDLDLPPELRGASEFVKEAFRKPRTDPKITEAGLDLIGLLLEYEGQISREELVKYIEDEEILSEVIEEYSNMGIIQEKDMVYKFTKEDKDMDKTILSFSHLRKRVRKKYGIR